METKLSQCPIVCYTIRDVRHHIAQLSQSLPNAIVLVPTMGALHKGHLQLVRQAKELGQLVVVSIFINPLQFGPTENFAGYPRTLETDLQLLQEEDVDIVFVPSTSQMYPSLRTTKVTAGQHPSTLLFEGSHRPNHFDGMLTVVAKLFHIIQPNVAVFGQKDAQQLYLVRQMVADLNIAVEIISAETVREKDGLAMSSRNRLLSLEERELAAKVVPKCLDVARQLAEEGRRVDEVLQGAKELVGKHEVRLDYLEVVDPSTFLAVGNNFLGGQALVIVAVGIGQVRLLDNCCILLKNIN